MASFGCAFTSRHCRLNLRSRLIPLVHSSRSQAPAWERESSKLRLGVFLETVALQFAKRSFEELRSQAGAWERDGIGNETNTRLG